MRHFSILNIRIQIYAFLAHHYLMWLIPKEALVSQTAPRWTDSLTSFQIMEFGTYVVISILGNLLPFDTIWEIASSIDCTSITFLIQA